jgi:dihydroorotase/N-acyl-D-amino-acid deacylase
VSLDVLITGGRIVDGTGNPWFRGDVGIAGGRIAAIAPRGTVDPASARELVGAEGHVVAPGFIDLQSHSITEFLTDGRSVSKVTQGVTTEIMGEGWTPAPRGGRVDTTGVRGFVDLPRELEPTMATWSRFGDWLAHMGDVGLSVNYGSFLGGGTLREYVKGWERGPASPAETDTMRRVVREALDDGAFGVATALIYPPGSYATDDELVAVCETLAERDGLYVTHVRSESHGLLEALADAIGLGRRTGCRIEIFHLKAFGERNWDKIPRAIELIDEARAEGIDVAANMYPYAAACTGLAAALPPWAAEDGRLLDNLADPVTRERIRAELVDPSPGWEPLASLSGPGGVLVGELTSERNRHLSNRRLSEIAAARDQEWPDCLIDLVLEEARSVHVVYFGMSEDNLPLQLRQPWMKVATDANGVDPADPGSGAPHPRSYGTYPRVLARYVRDEDALPLEDAIRKMTSAVADRLGLRDRGLLRVGMAADVVVFDPLTVQDHSTYDDPHRLSTGVRDVWVNGVQVLRDGAHTGATPGRLVTPP